MSNEIMSAVWEKRFTFVDGKPWIDCGDQSYCVNHIIAGILGEVGKERIFADQPLLTEDDYEAVRSYLPEFNRRLAADDLAWHISRARERAKAALDVAQEAVEQLAIVLKAIGSSDEGGALDMEVIGCSLETAINAKADDISITRLQNALAGMASDLAEAKERHAYLLRGDFSE